MKSFLVIACVAAASAGSGAFDTDWVFTDTNCQNLESVDTFADGSCDPTADGTQWSLTGCKADGSATQTFFSDKNCQTPSGDPVEIDPPFECQTDAVGGSFASSCGGAVVCPSGWTGTAPRCSKKADVDRKCSVEPLPLVEHKIGEI
jgi:hypothetical protein